MLKLRLVWLSHWKQILISEWLSYYGEVILVLVLSKRNNGLKGLLGYAIKPILLGKWYATDTEIKQKHPPITPSTSNSTDFSKLWRVAKGHLERWLKLNMCKYAGSLCRKVTLNAQIVPKNRKRSPLNLETFNNWLSKSNPTKKTKTKKPRSYKKGRILRKSIQNRMEV